MALYAFELHAQNSGAARGTSTRIFFVRTEALYAIELERQINLERSPGLQPGSTT